MIAVSEAWKNIQPRFLLPETFVEIDCTITEDAVQATATISGTNEANISNTISALEDNHKSVKYATAELNIWALDGSRIIAPDNVPYASIGYVSETAAEGSVTVRLPEIHTSTTSGVTITWGGRYNEYPSTFEIITKNGNNIVSYKKIEGNTSQVSAVFEQMQNYDNITINVLEWSLPYRRVRIENVIIGHVLTFGKKDIINYSHEQSGHLNSGNLPKNSISFTLDNTDGRWDPTGMGQYLSERQRIIVRYGLDINGITEWIKAGTFYLSEWKVPSNGLEASFAARDIFEYLLNETYNGPITGTYYDFCIAAFESADVPDDFRYSLDNALKKDSAPIPSGTYTCAEIIQMCANACSCVIYQDRDGVLHIETLNKTNTEYVIPLSLSYSQPEIELSKPLKNVSVSNGLEGSTFVLPVGNSGETQTVDNPLIINQHQAVAEWVRDTLVTRKTVSGEFRADPRLDVFDIVSVQSKYGDLATVAITDIKYTYNGSFRGSYDGRLLGEV